MPRNSELTALPREALLETDAHLSTNEMRAIAGQLGMVDATILFRVIPQKLIETLEARLTQTRDMSEMMRTLHAAFVIYRECVNRDFTAPVSAVNEVYEWPEPAQFGWDNPEALQYLGFLLGAFKRQEGVTVHVPMEENGRFFEIISNAQTGELSEVQLTSLQAHPEKELEFRVPKIGNLAFLNSFAWQNHSLRRFARGVSICWQELADGRQDWDEVDSFIRYIFEMAKNPVQLPARRVAKSGESSATGTNLFVMDFS